MDQIPEGAEVLDYTGYSIAPGLVDTHIHGYAGVDGWTTTLKVHCIL